MPLKVLMMGTGTFALPAFQAMIESSHEVVGLVTQPDRTGRGHHRHVNEMKELALQHNIEVFQPENVNTPEVLERLRNFDAEIFVVAAYGQILSADLLAIPRLGAINLHGSLLPKYRGAAPVQYAVLNGDKESGVTIFQIEPKLDAGPILGMVKTEIRNKETSGQLHDRLAELSAPLTLEVLARLESGEIEKLPQPIEGVTKAPKIRKEQGLIDWSRSAKEIVSHVFGMQPWPLGYTYLHLPDKKPVRLILLDVVESEQDSNLTDKDLPDNEFTPGKTIQNENRMVVECGDGLIEVLSLQPAGKRVMSAEQFLCGTDISHGTLSAEP